MKEGKYRKGVFIVVYSRTRRGIEYLVLKRELHWKGWEFPKGGKRFYENDRMAVRRELKEETGLLPLNVEKFDVEGSYIYNKELSDRKLVSGQSFVLFGVEVKRNPVKIDKREHSEYKWLSFDEAMKILTWPNQKKCLGIVNDWLKDSIRKV